VSFVMLSCYYAGQGSFRDGGDGNDLYIRVPVGTIIRKKDAQVRSSSSMAAWEQQHGRSSMAAAAAWQHGSSSMAAAAAWQQRHGSSSSSSSSSIGAAAAAWEQQQQQHGGRLPAKVLWQRAVRSCSSGLSYMQTPPIHSANDHSKVAAESDSSSSSN
jgi:hypothetical protein